MVDAVAGVARPFRAGEMTVQTYSKEYVDKLIAVVEVARPINQLNYWTKRSDWKALNDAFADLDQTSQKPCNHDDITLRCDIDEYECLKCGEILYDGPSVSADSKQRSFVVRSRQSVDTDELDEQRQPPIGYDTYSCGCKYPGGTTDRTFEVRCPGYTDFAEQGQDHNTERE